jgi:hypothetical protein
MEQELRTVFRRPTLEGSINQIKKIEEYHKKDFIRIFIFKRLESGQFVYGYQLKVAKLVRQKAPFPGDVGQDSLDAAQTAAWTEIIKICSENRAKRAIAVFSCNHQLSLF